MSAANKTTMPDTKTKLGPLTFKNPVMVAAGTFGYGAEKILLKMPVNKLGAFITKTITLEPRLGNPPPRLAEVAGGIVNSIGLENPGIDAFCRDYLPKIKHIKTTKIVSIGGSDEYDFAKIVRVLNRQKGINALEVNVSCPNVKKGGLCIAQDPEVTRKITRIIKRASRYPVIVKLSPNVTSVVNIALAAQDGGADILSLINTVAAMAVNWKKRCLELGNGTGGLSGPAIKPIALKMVWEVSRAVRIPVIGIGGIINADDVMEFLVAGASAVQVGTLNLITPTDVFSVIDDLPAVFKKYNIKSVRSVVGTLRMGN
ncbi:MAG: dihydroorotate dehydrogenase [Planctomycetota bacterium]